MSKFIDKLNSIYKTLVPAIGFQRPKEIMETYPMVVVSSLSKLDIKKTKTLVSNSVDAAIIDAKDIDIKNLTETLDSSLNFPVGLMLDENISKTGYDDLINSGLDFLIFGLNTSIELASKENVGKILKIDTTLPHALIRTINELNSLVDAVLISSNTLMVTYAQILQYQLFSNLINKPVLINADATLTKNELANLHKAGIKGLILPEGTQLKVFVELKKKLAELPKATKITTRASAILPRTSPQSETSVEKVEEDDEEDDDA